MENGKLAFELLLHLVKGRDVKIIWVQKKKLLLPYIHLRTC